MNDEPVDRLSDTRRARKRLRILIADDYPEWRAQIRKILSSRPEWEIVAEARDGQDAFEKAVQLRPDLVLLDIAMPVLNGLQAAIRIRQHCPGSLIIFVSQINDRAVREAAVDVGAVAYVLKANAAAELLAAIMAAQDNIISRSDQPSTRVKALFP